MIRGRSVMVVITIAVMFRSALLLDDDVAVRLIKMMVAERKDEVERERCQRQPCPMPDPRANPPHVTHETPPGSRPRDQVML